MDTSLPYPVRLQNLQPFWYAMLEREHNRENIRDIFQSPVDDLLSGALYIHIPFCSSICRFCFYNRIAIKQGDPIIKDYLSALAKEIFLLSQTPWFKHLRVESVYLGGGTPSVLDAEDISRLLIEIKQFISLSSNAEITLEANPWTLTGDKLEAFRDVGGNRVSIGVQTFHPNHRERLGLLASVDKVIDCVELIKCKGFVKYGIDLLYGLPDQTVKEWEKDLQTAIEMKIPNIDCFDILVEPDTKLYWLQALGIQPQCPDTQTQVDMNRMSQELLSAYGYRQDNYIFEHYLPGHACGYKRQFQDGISDLVALGTGGIGHKGDYAYFKVGEVSQYMKQTSLCQLPIQAIAPYLRYPQNTIVHELRSTKIDKSLFRKRYGKDIKYYFGPTIARLKDSGMIEEDNVFLSLTPIGKIWMHNIALEFLDEKDREKILAEYSRYMAMDQLLIREGKTAEELWLEAIRLLRQGAV